MLRSTALEMTAEDAELVRRYARLVYATSWRVLEDEGDAGLTRSRRPSSS